MFKLSYLRGSAIVIIAILILFIASPNALANWSRSAGASSQVTGGRYLASQCPQISQKLWSESAIPNVRARDLAWRIAGQMKFESASNSWDIGPSCSITRISVDLEYQDVNQTLIVSLNPNLTSILGTKYLPNGLVAGPVNNPNWVGYEYHPGPALAQSSMEFYLPSASAGTVGCSTGCAFFVWNGLTAQSGGGSGSGKGIAQGGSASFVACNIHGCTSTYSFFYEFFPAGPNYCSASVNAGDLMDTVVSTANSAGNPTNNYNIAVYDDTNGHACTPSTKNGWSIGDAYYSQFMGELPPGTPQQALPRFSTVDVGPGSYCTTTTSCQLIGTNYINYYIMFNGGSDDATPTAVSNYAFTIVYHTSTGT